MPMQRRKTKEIAQGVFAAFSLFILGLDAIGCSPDLNYANREQQIRKLATKACLHNENNPYLQILEFSENPDRAAARGIFFHKGERYNADLELVKLANEDAKRKGACQQSLSEMAAYESVIRQQITSSCETVSRLDSNCRSQNNCNLKDQRILLLAREAKGEENMLFQDYRLTMQELIAQHSDVIRRLEMAASNPAIDQNPDALSHIQSAIEEHKKVRSVVSSRLNDTSYELVQGELTLKQYDHQIALLNSKDLATFPGSTISSPSGNSNSVLSTMGALAPMAGLLGQLFSTKAQATLGENGQASAMPAPELSSNQMATEKGMERESIEKSPDAKTLGSSTNSNPLEQASIAANKGLNLETPDLGSSEIGAVGNAVSQSNLDQGKKKTIEKPLIPASTAMISSKNISATTEEIALKEHDSIKKNSASSETSPAENDNPTAFAQRNSDGPLDSSSSIDQILANMLQTTASSDSNKPLDHTTEQASINAAFVPFLNKQTRALASVEPPTEELGSENLSLFTRHSQRLLLIQQKGNVFGPQHFEK